MKRFLCLILMLCLLFSTSCRREPADVIRIGVNLALTGVSAPYGEDALAGIRAAADRLNTAGGIHGRKVILRILDNASRTDLAACAAKRLEQSGVCAVIGPSLSHLTRAALKSTDQVCLLTPGSTAVPLKPFGAEDRRLLRLCFTDDVQGAALARYARKAGFHRAAVLYDPALDYSVSITEAFRRTF